MLSTTEKYAEPFELNELNKATAVWKITALWAFSEAAMGGILHAFKIPFRGVFIGGSAAILISLIAFLSKEKGIIFRSTVIVIIIKGMVSPYTPLTAYFAVFLQGIMGEMLFFNRKFFKLSAFILGVLTLLFSSMQKLIILTILFGNTFWDSINHFSRSIVSEFFSQNNAVDLNFSYTIVGIYLGIHIILGSIVGFFAGKFPIRILRVINHEKSNLEAFYLSLGNEVADNKKIRKHWWEKPGRIFLVAIILGMLLLSYLYPQSGMDKTLEVIIMVLRAIIIMMTWYFLLAPLLLKLLQKLLKKKQNQYSIEINRIIDNFPHFRKLVYYCWKTSSKKRGYKKITSFLILLVTLLLLTDFEQPKTVST